MPITLCLQGGENLRYCLGLSEEDVLFSAGYLFADARGYLLYRAADEVQKAGMYLMRLQEAVSEELDKTDKTHVTRLITTHVIEEQQARIRRLLELLVMLVLFSTTNDQPYYQHMLRFEALDDILSKNDDLKEFYGARNANLDHSISMHIDAIKEDEKQINLAKCWYLRKRSSIKMISNPLPGRILSSMRSRIRSSLPLMTNNEKLLFGFTYGASYGRASENVHFSPMQFDLPQNVTYEYHIGLLCASILDRCYLLLGQPDVPGLKKIHDSLNRTTSTELVKKVTVREMEIGNIVLAYGDLAEIIDVKTSSHGYRSYLVRYLAEKPMPQISKDWFPAYLVQLLYTKTQFMEKIAIREKEGSIPAGTLGLMKGFSEEELLGLIRESMVVIWNVGLRDWIRKKQS
ncbi:MAG: hypothetical protein FVQ79_11935 [Planctomycetes bacterium]|nr:hypothetical protein [Planctomycetota bacterium]